MPRSPDVWTRDPPGKQEFENDETIALYPLFDHASANDDRLDPASRI